MKKRVLALLMVVILCLSLLPTVVFAATGDTVLAFTSDMHNGSGNTAANRLDSWIDKVQLAKGGIDYMGFCGDMGDSYAAEDAYWNYTKAVKDVVSEEEIEGGYTTGNHEFINGNFSSTSNATKSYFTVDAEAKNGDNYRIYCLGSNSSNETYSPDQVTKLSSYLAAIDVSKPIFVLTHFPLHSYGGRTASNADKVIEALNSAATSGKKIVLLWGHNHTVSDPSYDQIFQPGSSIKVGSSNSTTTIQFYYAAAGCMSDIDYSGGSASVNGKGLVVTVSSSDELQYTYYDKNGSAIGGSDGGDESGNTYTKVDTPETGKQYLIVAQDGSNYYGLTSVPNNGYTNSSSYSYSGFNGTAVTVTNNKVTSAVSDDMIWKLETGSGTDFLIKNVKDSNYLGATYNSTGNKGGALTLVGSGEGWKYSTSSTSSLKLVHSTTTKHLTYENPGDVNGSIKSGSADLFTVRSSGDNVFFYEVATATNNYTVTVNNGTGDGNFAEGATVSITADSPAAGYIFDKWTPDDVTFADVNSSSTTFTMPAKNVAVTATYKAAPQATLISIAIKTPATKLVYKVGETLDITGLVIEGTYSDATKKTETITTANLTGFESSTAVASQTLTVTVDGKSTTYTVEIKAASGGGGGGGGGSDSGGGYIHTVDIPKPVVPSGPADPSNEKVLFDDVPENGWYYDAVQYVAGRGLLNGVSDHRFEPDKALTRGMLVTMLWRLEDEPEVITPILFTDIDAGTWYANAVNWAHVNGIVKGYDTDSFGPNDPVTREQMATIFYRYASYKGYDVTSTDDLAKFNDSDEISSWALTTVKWAVAEGLITGVTKTSIDPAGNTSRAQAAAILMRFVEGKEIGSIK